MPVKFYGLFGQSHGLELELKKQIKRSIKLLRNSELFTERVASLHQCTTNSKSWIVSFT